MSYQFIKGRYYRMPTHFGPTPGPRQIPEGKPNNPRQSPHRRVSAVAARTTAEALGRLLPPGFELADEPVISVEYEELTQIDWLAGRGYNTLGVKFAAKYSGQTEQPVGNFLAILWENLADPILSGREELGFSKLYCELPEPAILNGAYSFTAGWLGHRFFEMKIDDLKDVDETAQTPGRPSLHYKYMPRTGTRDEPDVAYVTLNPPENPYVTVKKKMVGSGRFAFTRSSWEQLPTLYHVVNAFADLPIQAFLGATITWSVGGKDLSDQRIVR